MFHSFRIAYISMDSLSVLYEYALAHNCVTYTEYIPLLGTPKITFPLKEACLSGDNPIASIFILKHVGKKMCFDLMNDERDAQFSSYRFMTSHSQNSSFLSQLSLPSETNV